MTVHITANPPSERVSTSARHVSAQESRRRGDVSLHWQDVLAFKPSAFCQFAASLPFCFFPLECTKHFLVSLRGFVCKLFEKQIINQENGMLTKEATSWTVVATSSALFKKSLLSFF